jgi:hypothetical protein
VDRFARVVLGYHGCDADFADSILSGETSVRDWRESRNRYDWLGHGIYFWEHAPERALEWAAVREKRGVIGAVIQLGVCLDFTDVRYTSALNGFYKNLKESYAAAGRDLPPNGRGNRVLDCLVINELVRQTDVGFQTVRSPFLEGPPAFPRSGIRKQSHIQVAVVDRSCILGVFRPNIENRKA